MTALKILLIDDDELFRKAARLALERKSHVVVEADEGGAGIRQFKREKFDIVITDMIMPGMEGLETIRELRALDPAVKIIAISGGGRLDARDYLPIARRLGASAILDKPIAEEALMEAIARVLGLGATD